MYLHPTSIERNTKILAVLYCENIGCHPVFKEFSLMYVPNNDDGKYNPVIIKFNTPQVVNPIDIRKQLIVMKKTLNLKY